eukprot:TRINITY_DN5710_c0_g1_i1.p1 TRINITY_DN5710_c0_g1~~TRINITY_DN5710_c0_g1_i1.p1  ORF type:complete len:239 (-),score=81.95 TRINITY_DN5710_c0_g1_i1:114-830(-)
MEGQAVMFGKDENSKTYGAWTVNITPSFTLPLKYHPDLSVQLVQNATGKGELGSRVWSCSIPLAHFVENQQEFPLDFWKEKKVIELGSGCGLVGITAAVLGADIVLTDQSSLIPLLNHNISLNRQTNQSPLKAKADVLMWGSGNPFGHPFDVILGADLTYEYEDLPLLLSSIEQLSDHNTVTYIAYGEERAVIGNFFKLLEEKFEYEKVSPSLIVEEGTPNDIATTTPAIVKLRKKKK